VRNVTAANAAELMKEDWVLLDVRPPAEIAKAGVIGATEVRSSVCLDHETCQHLRQVLLEN